MHSPEKIKELRTKMIDHLEKAIGAADEAGDFTTSLLIERALDSASGPMACARPTIGCSTEASIEVN